MSARPKTIQIYLPGGDPRGIRVAEITTRIVQVIEVPRSLLSEFLKMSESDRVAVYFLVGEDEEAGEPRVYVGQSGDVRSRLVKHNSEKDFWERALVLISRTNSLTQTHALFLEWHCLQAMRVAGRYRGENNNSGSRPFTPAPLEADCLEIFETGHALVSTLGFPLFDAVASAGTSNDNPEVFFCTRRGAQGRGLYTPEGFVVLAGSRGPLDLAPSLVGTSDGRMRDPLLELGVLVVEGESIVFTKDHLFRTPSGAAYVLLGRSANGWIEWKASDGQTLDTLKRQRVEA
jgi:hypothetical protein